MATTLTHSPLRAVLDRLEGVQKAGKGWRARCPACTGRSRKVAITEADNGAILLHCFAGCPAAEVVAAVGLTLADLYPERILPTTPEERRAVRQRMREAGWAAALDLLAFEATIVGIAGEQIAGGEPLSDADLIRVRQAVARIGDARGVLNARTY